MRRIITTLLLVAVVMSLFGSCAKGTGVSGGNPALGTSGWESEPGNTAEGKKITVLFTVTDGGRFSHQERFDSASRILAEAYGIEVERYQVPGYEEITDFFESPDSPVSRVVYFDKLYAEIMAGRGPDVYLFGSMGVFHDLPKKMDAGAFYDLNEFIEKDNDFDITEYEEILMNEGVYKGKRFVFPLTYSVTALLISREKFETLGLSAEDYSTYERFISTWEDIQRTDNLRMFADSMSGWKLFVISRGWLEECVDYESGTTDFDTPSFRRVVELLQEEYRLENHSEPLFEFESFPDGLFYTPSFITLLFSSLYPIDANDIMLLPIPNASGNSTARIMECCMISSSAKDPEAAWLFVKAMMSDECQREMMSHVFNNNITTKSAFIDEDIETKLSSYPIYDPRYMYDDAVVAMIKEWYHGYDNAVIPYGTGRDLYLNISGYIESDEEQDFDRFKNELENYYEVYLSE